MLALIVIMLAVGILGEVHADTASRNGADGLTGDTRREIAPAIPHDDPHVLFDFNTVRFPTEYESLQGATLDIVSREDHTIVKVTAGADNNGSGIRFNGKWNFSYFSYLAISVENLQDTTIRLRILYRGYTFAGEARENLVEHTLGPKQRDIIRCPISLIEGYEADGTPIRLNGPLWWPWGMPVNKRAISSTLNPATVFQIQVSTLPSKAPTAFAVKNIQLEESRVHPNTGSHLAASPMAPNFFPFIDQFGQYKHWDWPGKTHNEAELRASIQTERNDLDAHPRPAIFTKYGGYRDGGRFKATGHFRTQKIDGKWWIIDPEGYKFISWGIDYVMITDAGTAIAPVDRHLTGPQYDRLHWFDWLPSWDDPAYAMFYIQEEVSFWNRAMGWNFDFHAYNQLRKYGADYKTQAVDMMFRRLASWGMNTMSRAEKAARDKKGFPYTIYIVSSSNDTRRIGDSGQEIIDPYDPGFAASLQSACAVLDDMADDPWFFGYFIDNELIWWGSKGWLVPKGALQAPADEPAKIAFKEELAAKYKTIGALNEAWETHYTGWDDLMSTTSLPDMNDAVKTDYSQYFLTFARQYYSTVRAVAKARAPNILYLGSRIHTPHAKPEVVRAASEYCDIASYNLYHKPALLHRKLQELFKPNLMNDTPFLISEFDFLARDRGMWGVYSAAVQASNQADRAANMIAYVKTALDEPLCVGLHWLSYRDRTLTGHSKSGNNPQTGFLDVCDRPYIESVGASREIGRNLYQYREKGQWTH